MYTQFRQITYVLCFLFFSMNVFSQSQLSIVTSLVSSCNGEITLSVAGGTPPYAYKWFKLNEATASWDVISGETSRLITGLTPGDYKIEVSDAVGNMIDAQYTVNSGFFILGDVDFAGLVCEEDGNSGVIHFTFINGVPAYSWELKDIGGNIIQNGTTEELGITLYGIALGDYVLEWTDGNGCSSTKDISIASPAIRTLTINTQKNVSCFNGNNGEVEISLAGGWGADYGIRLVKAIGSSEIEVLNWTNIGAGQNYVIPGLEAGVYRVYHQDKLLYPPFSTDYDIDMSNYPLCEKYEEFIITQPNELISSNAGEALVCFGNTDGNITGTITGGIAPYTIQMDGTATQFTGILDGGNFDFSGLSAGDYTFTITDANGCIETTQASITQPDQIIANFINSQDVLCNGGDEGSITVSVTGGVPNYTFTVNGTLLAPTNVTGDNYTFGNLPLGAYSIVVSDQNNCSADKVITKTISEPVALNVSIFGETLVCYGDTDGNITGSISGGLGPYTIKLDGLGTIINVLNDGDSFDFSGLSSGAYNFTITDANNCLTTATASILENDLVANESIQNVTCPGGGGGTITLNPTGVSGPFAYSWVPSNGGFVSPGQENNKDITSLIGGDYTVTITAGSACTFIRTFSIVEPVLNLTGITKDYNGFEISGFGKSDGEIDVTLLGAAPPFAYLWTASNGGVIPVGQDNNEDVTGLIAGTYKVTITDANGCTIEQQWNLTEPVDLLISEVLASHNDVLCFGDATGVIEVMIDQGSVANYTFTLTDTGTTNVIEQVPNQPGPNHTFTNIISGTYDITVTDANGVSKIMIGVVISQPASGLLISNAVVLDYNGFGISCNGANDGDIDITVTGGTPGYTYSWIGPNGFIATTQDISLLGPGDYTVTITDSTGVCEIVQGYAITEPIALSLTGTPKDYNGFEISGFGKSDGEIDITLLGGATPFAYLWTATSGGVIPVGQENNKDVAGLISGTYKVTITDANGCTIEQQWNLTEPVDLLISEVLASHNDVLCFGDATGVIEVMIDQGSVANYTFTLTDTGTTNVIEQVPNQPGPNHTFTNIVSGTYDITVTDANGIKKKISNIFVDTLSPEIFSNITTTNLSCFNANDGSITIEVSGGVAPYSYDWNDFGNGAIRTNLAAGVYDVTITDNVGCQQQRQIEVFNTPLFDVNPVVSHISCFSESDGAIQLNLVGGEAPVTVTWSDDASAGVDRFNLAPGTYQVSINDNSSCSIDRSFVVKEPAKLVLDGIVTDAIGCDNPNSGAIDLLVTGGKFPYTFDWNTGFATTEDLTNIGPDNYTVLVTDASGCQVSKQFTVVRQKPIIAEITTEISGNCDTKEVTQRNVLNVTGGISPYTITWSGGITSGVNNEIMDATENGIYTATITDALGCVRTESIDVLLPIIIGEPGFEYTSFGLKEYNVLSVKDPITFTNTTTGDYVSFLWDFGNGVTSTEFNPTYTYLDEGVFNVSLTVFYPFNCSYTINISLTVTKGYELVLPNGFTPNGDSINDVIRPIYKGMIDVEMSIYDTWGSLLYHEKSDKIKGWNGTLEGKEVENGNYIMVVKATVFHGLVLKLNGPVTLIK